jgi:hypothetical protein
MPMWSRACQAEAVRASVSFGVDYCIRIQYALQEKAMLRASLSSPLVICLSAFLPLCLPEVKPPRQKPKTISHEWARMTTIDFCEGGRNGGGGGRWR